MGSWFSSLHIRKNGRVQPDDLLRQIRELMTERRYVPVPSADETDVSFAVLSGADSQWLSVYSDWLEPGNMADGLTASLSARLGTDVMEIACFDSDYLYLNLIDAAAQTDAWAGVGSAAGMGIKRRTNLSAWQKKVEDFPRFKESIQQKRIFAEEALCDIAPCLGLPAELSNACYEELEGGERLHFQLLDRGEAEGPVPAGGGRTPWEPEAYEHMCAINEGGASRGLSVFIIAPGLTSGEVTLHDVCLTVTRKREQVSIPIELEKVRLEDGGWAYYYHDPNIKIPARVPDGLPVRKHMEERYNRAIGVRFLPQGELDKVADITVYMVPDAPHEGHVVWWLWWGCESKEAFIVQRREHERHLAEWLRDYQALRAVQHDKEKPD